MAAKTNAGKYEIYLTVEELCEAHGIVTIVWALASAVCCLSDPSEATTKAVSDLQRVALRLMASANGAEKVGELKPVCPMCGSTDLKELDRSGKRACNTCGKKGI
jgi:hypothetical protein